MRALIVGAGGQLGTDLVAACHAEGDDVVGLDREALDVSDRGAVLAAVADSRPDVVFNAAAWTAVDACEADPDRAMLVNGTAVRWLAEGCDATGAHLLHISTDYVFDGTLHRPYVEDDETNPQSAYGVSKLAGEREALLLGDRCTVVRTSWVSGLHGGNIVKTIVRLAGQGTPMQFVDDQRGCPTFTGDLAPLLRRLATDQCSGVVHATNQGATTWYGFACDVVAAMGIDPTLVTPISTAELVPPRPAPRPANSVLDNAVLRTSAIPLLRDYHEPLAELVRALR